MAILTISTPGDLDNLLLPEHESCYCLDRIHIIIINMNQSCLETLGLTHEKIVYKIRHQKHLNEVPLIFSKDTENTLFAGEIYADILG